MVQPRLSTDVFDPNAPFVGAFVTTNISADVQLLQCGIGLVGDLGMHSQLQVNFDTATIVVFPKYWYTITASNFLCRSLVFLEAQNCFSLNRRITRQLTQTTLKRLRWS